MQIGIDSFALARDDAAVALAPVDHMRNLIDQIAYADEVGLDVFGVGGTPASFVRAGLLGLPLMVAIIGGETHRFRPLVDLYREAGRRAGHPPEMLRVGMHALGYVADTAKEAADDFYPGFARVMTDIGKERGWAPMTRAQFDANLTPKGAWLLGSPEEVTEKILRHSEALGGLVRVTFQMNAASVPHEKLLHATELLGTKVAPVLHKQLAPAAA